LNLVGGFEILQHVDEFRNTKSTLPNDKPLTGLWISPPTLYPTKGSREDSGVLHNQLFSGLVELDPIIGIAPDVARDWELSEDGLRYRFHLRDDALWSDGVPLTAHDFAYAWKRVLHPENSRVVASTLFDIRNAGAYHSHEVDDSSELGIRVIDDHTLEIALEQPRTL
jgi:oligopeptide transport system substrate-binding protein